MEVGTRPYTTPDLVGRRALSEGTQTSEPLFVGVRVRENFVRTTLLHSIRQGSPNGFVRRPYKIIKSSL